MVTTSLQKAVDIVGGQVALADAIKEWHKANGKEVRVAQGHVWNWLNITKTPMPPAEHCRAIEDSTGGKVTRYDLRPDVFGESPFFNHDRRVTDRRDGDRRHGEAPA